MKKFYFIVLSLIYFVAFAIPTRAQLAIQPTNWIDALNLKGGFPEKLLSTRSIVFYDYHLTAKQVNEVHEYFQRTGIDAIGYFHLDMVMANADVTKAFADYLQKREVSNLVLVEKEENNFRITITFFNNEESLVSPNQQAWSVSNSVLTEALKNLYRTASSQQKKQNF